MPLYSPAVVSMSSLPLLSEGEAGLVAVLLCQLSVVSTSSLLSEGELLLMSTSTSPLSEREPVVVLVLASTAVGERAGGDAGAPVSSDTDVVVSGSAIVEVEIVVLQWSSATAPLATADGEVSLGSTPSGSSTAGNEGEGVEALVPGCDRVCRCE